MNNFKLSIDRNGNKIVKVSIPKGGRGFSIQTNGNLPLTHHMTIPVHNIILMELEDWLAEHGTPQQITVLNNIKRLTNDNTA